MFIGPRCFFNSTWLEISEPSAARAVTRRVPRKDLQANWPR